MFEQLLEDHLYVCCFLMEEQSNSKRIGAAPSYSLVFIDHFVTCGVRSFTTLFFPYSFHHTKDEYTHYTPSISARPKCCVMHFHFNNMKHTHIVQVS